MSGNAPDEPVRTEAGLDLTNQATGHIMENVLVTSRRSSFQAANQFGGSASTPYSRKVLP